MAVHINYSTSLHDTLDIQYVSYYRLIINAIIDKFKLLTL